MPIWPVFFPAKLVQKMAIFYKSKINSSGNEIELEHDLKEHTVRKRLILSTRHQNLGFGYYLPCCDSFFEKRIDFRWLAPAKNRGNTLCLLEISARF